MSKVNPGVKVTLDKERTLKYDLNAMVAYEEAIGESMFKLDLKVMSAKQLRALVWAGLIHEDEHLTLKQVGALDLSEMKASIMEAVGNAMPEGEGEKGDPLPVPPSG